MAKPWNKGLSMKNKKGSLGIAIITSIVVLIIGLMCINFIKDEVTQTRTDLDCSNAAGISDGSKILCLVVDVTVIYWIWIIISVVIGGVVSKLIL